MKKYFCVVILSLVTFFEGNGRTLSTDSIFLIKEPRDFIPLNLVSFLLKDKEGKLTIDSVLKQDKNFHPIRQEMYSFKQDEGIEFYWVRCFLDNRTQKELRDLLCLQSGLDSMESFIFNPDGTVNHSKSQSNQLARTRPFFISQQIAIPLSLQPGITKIYLRINNHSIRSFETKNIIVSLADERIFLNYFLESRLYQGAVLGMLFLLLILHIFIYWYVREKAYLIFLLNLFFTLLYLILRKNFQFEFDFLSPVINPLTESHDGVGMIVGITAIGFSQVFLNTRKTDPVVHQLLNGLMVMMGIAMICSITAQWINLMNGLSIYLGFLSGLLIIFSSVRSYRRGNRLALYIFFGFFLLAAVPIIYIIPLPNYLDFRVEESNILYLGEAIRCLIFSAGIAERFYFMKGQVDRSEVEKGELVRTQEIKLKSEKERISSDLHDNIGSELALLSLELGQLSKEYSNPQQFSEVLKTVQAVNNQLHDTVWALEKNLIAVHDLETRLNTKFWRYRESHSNIEFSFETSVTDPFLAFTPSQGVNLIRIIQEAIQNAIKHSGCRQIKIRIYTMEDSICLEVADNGKGFDYNQSAFIEEGHYGLRNMRKRAREINGDFEICSEEFHGTKIKVTLPAPLKNFTTPC